MFALATEIAKEYHKRYHHQKGEKDHENQNSFLIHIVYIFGNYFSKFCHEKGFQTYHGGYYQ
jgi:hypothetical protein